MAKKKYYAVKQGRKTGIFQTWDDCKKQVEGFSNAIYKSFTSLEEAQSFLQGGNVNIGEIDENENSPYKTVIAYVDGSYFESQQLFSYGCIILDEKETKLSGVGTDPELLSMRNVAGEILGSMKAIEWAVENGYEKIIIYHDYEGIARWALGDWKANKKGTQDYVKFIRQHEKKIKIEFKKVKAHSGNKYNEEADKLAKKAIEKHSKAN